MRVAVSFLLVATIGLTLAFTVGSAGHDRAHRVFNELKPLAMSPFAYGVSPKVSSFGPAVPDGTMSSKLPADQKAREVPNREPFRKVITNNEPDSESKLAPIGPGNMPGPLFSFDGLSSNDNAAAYGFRVIPPDTIGDVGFDHYVQAVNLLVRVFDKSGNALTPPFKMSSLFAPLGTACSNRNDGDPNVVFDPLANRWILSQFCTAFPPFRQLLAISKTGDPTGEYFIYEFVMPNVKLNDYPKFGVWSDAYFMSTDEFLGSDYAGTGIFAFDRKKLLAGDPTASYVYFDLASPTTIRLGGLLPADLDGLRPPPPDSPGIFVGYTATEYGDAADALRLFEVRPDFADPAASTFAERAESPIAVAAFDPTSPNGREDIAQPTPGERLDSQSDRLMYRVAYRNHGAFESLVFNQTVRVTPPNQSYRAGVRVYELRKTAGQIGFTVNEAATVGDSSTSRFMGAAAQDGDGNIAVGFNTSNEEKQPSIVYAGRLATDPPGTFRNEAELVRGTGVQRTFGFRWGDYSGLSVDPVDDCTFWITNQYYSLASEQESDFGWLTRIGKFRFAECSDQATTRIIGDVRNAVTSAPISGAVVEIDSVYSRSTGSDGRYPDLFVPQSAAGYQIRASARGFGSITRSVSANLPGPVTENFLLTPVALIESDGFELTDESCVVNEVIEPGEVVTVEFSLENNGALATKNLTAVLRQSGGVTNPSSGQNFGALVPGGPSVSRPFQFRASPGLTCGDPLIATFDLFDNGAPAGEVSIELATGRRRVAFAENFDGISNPGLPAGWTTSQRGAQQNWSTSSVQTQSVPNSAFSPAPNQIGANELVTPEIAIVSGDAVIEFRNWYELETTFLRNRLYDGSIFEIRIGSGDWQDIETAGGVFLSGGYDGVIDSCCSNPFGGRRGWSGRSGPNQAPEWVTAKARLPVQAAGQMVQFRWRVGTDIGTFRTGQFIDDIKITDGYICDCAAPQSRSPFDFDGDGKTDLGQFRPSDVPAEQDFAFRLSSNSAITGNSWGSIGDKAANADFDGDGRFDIAVYRPASGTWFILGSKNSAITIVNFGLSADHLVPDDYDGDGKADIAVFRPSDGTWYIIESQSSTNRIERFGLFGDLPVNSDFDGDGSADIGVFRPSSGTWYIRSSASNSVGIERFGLAGDRPVIGDFDGDGKSDLSLFRPADRTWYQQRSKQGFQATQFGLPTDVPLQGDFDGDGIRDIAVYRPAGNEWFWIGSSGGSSQQVFGQLGDLPIPGIFVR